MSLYRTAREPQPEYPLLDLTLSNKLSLASEMTNRLLVEQQPDSATQKQLELKVDHPSITVNASEIRDGYYIDAIGHGLAMLTAISVSVDGLRPSAADVFRIDTGADKLLIAAHDGRIGDDALEALQVFEEQMPHTREVIVVSSKRYFGSLTKFALLGAAIERQMILDSVV